MPDISMCASVCPKSRQCYRHEDSGTRPSKYHQSYILPAAVPCNYFRQVSPAVKATHDGSMP